tara:strand:+ start:15546 stop:15890 length:345 start_codon:yes stop_codon:yes gene_type:complete
MRAVNGILLHHNIEKQMSDSRGEVAYLMADISDVKEGEIRDLFQSLEELSCMFMTRCRQSREEANSSSVHPDEGALLDTCRSHVSAGPDKSAHSSTLVSGGKAKQKHSTWRWAR